MLLPHRRSPGRSHHRRRGPEHLRRRREPAPRASRRWPSRAALPCRAPCATWWNCASNTSSIDGGEHQLKNVSRSVQVFHVRQAKLGLRPGHDDAHGAADHAALRRPDSAGRKHTFEVTLEKLVAQSEGMVHRPRRRAVRTSSSPHPTVSRRHAKLQRGRRGAAGRGSRLDQRHRRSTSTALQGRRAGGAACRHRSCGSAMSS